MEPRRILITGATGFVGRHLVARLLADGNRLTLAVRDAASCPQDWCGNEAVRVVETGAIEDASDLADALIGVDAVVHLAGLAHVHGAAADGGEADFMRANALATQKLAEAAADASIGTFVHLSSLGAITGNDAGDVVDDDTPPRSTTAYGRSKLASEPPVLALAQKGILAVCLRPPLVVGRGAKGNWGLLHKLAASGLWLPFAHARNRRSLIGVGSLVEAIALLCNGRHPATRSGAYCIADPEAVPLWRIVSELRAGMGMSPRLFPFPPRGLLAIARILGQGRRGAGLFGTLEVDGGRFDRTFGFRASGSIVDAIRQAGAPGEGKRVERS